MNPILHELQSKQWVWSATSAKQQEQQQRHKSTGFDSLDQALNAGFPSAGLIHISSVLGCGELRLMLQIIQHQLSQDDDRFWVMISPPGNINAEFLLAQGLDLSRLIVIQKTSSEEALWSAEQCAKSNACSGVFIWPKTLNHLQVRKLELASQQGQSYCIWFDASQRKHSNLPLSLSMALTRRNNDLILTINKQKQGWARQPVKLPLPFHCKRRFNPRLRENNVANVVNLRSQ